MNCPVINNKLSHYVERGSGPDLRQNTPQESKTSVPPTEVPSGRQRGATSENPVVRSDAKFWNYFAGATATVGLYQPLPLPKAVWGQPNGLITVWLWILGISQFYLTHCLQTLGREMPVHYKLFEGDDTLIVPGVNVRKRLGRGTVPGRVLESGVDTPALMCQCQVFIYWPDLKFKLSLHASSLNDDFLVCVETNPGPKKPAKGKDSVSGQATIACEKCGERVAAGSASIIAHLKKAHPKLQKSSVKQGGVQDSPARESKPSGPTRSSKRNDLIANSLIDTVSELRGTVDALKERIREEDQSGEPLVTETSSTTIPIESPPDPSEIELAELKLKSELAELRAKVIHAEKALHSLENQGTDPLLMWGAVGDGPVREARPNGKVLSMYTRADCVVVGEMPKPTKFKPSPHFSWWWGLGMVVLLSVAYPIMCLWSLLMLDVFAVPAARKRMGLSPVIPEMMTLDPAQKTVLTIDEAFHLGLKAFLPALSFFIALFLFMKWFFWWYYRRKLHLDCRLVLVSRMDPKKVPQDDRPHCDRSEILANTVYNTYQVMVEVEFVRFGRRCFAYYSTWYDDELPSMWFNPRKTSLRRSWWGKGIGQLKTVQLNQGMLSLALNRKTLMRGRANPAVATEAMVRLMESSPLYQEDYQRLLQTGRSTYRDMELVCGAIVRQDVYLDTQYF